MDFELGWFLDPLMFGHYTGSMQNLVGKRRPRFSNQEPQSLSGSLDFVGINTTRRYMQGTTWTRVRKLVMNDALAYADVQSNYLQAWKENRRNGSIELAAHSSLGHVQADETCKREVWKSARVHYRIQRMAWMIQTTGFRNWKMPCKTIRGYSTTKTTCPAC